jgi:predicted thioesterase
MEHLIVPGIEGFQTIRVKKANTAIVYGSGSVEVFATPAMVALMEKTAMESVSSLLPAESITVGTHISVSHVKATAIGTRVNCRSILKAIDGRKLLFDVTAEDEKGIIGSASHTRYIVNKQRFMDNL